jgi:chromosome segregation ATPase
MRETQERLKRAKDRLAEVNATLSTRVEGVNNLERLVKDSTQEAGKAVDRHLFKEVSDQQLAEIRGRRDQATKALADASEELEAARRAVPKLTAEIQRLEAEVGQRVRLALRKRLDALQDEALGRVADLLIDAQALIMALEVLGPPGAVLMGKAKLASSDETTARYRAIRAEILNGGV